MPQETGSHDDLEGKSLNTKRIEKKKKKQLLRCISINLGTMSECGFEGC